jgi:hypothetical protein
LEWFRNQVSATFLKPDTEDGIRIQAKLLAIEGDYAASVQTLCTLLPSKYRAKELELKGMNLRDDEGQEVRLTLNDFAQPYKEELAKNKELTERVVARLCDFWDSRGAACFLIRSNNALCRF